MHGHLNTQITGGSHRHLVVFIIAGSLSSLLSVVFWMALEWRTFNIPLPFEDAAMLFRYAENLATGGGISWNFGENPSATDGATDLGFVLTLAPLIYLGLNSTIAALVINLAAISGIGALIGAASAMLWRLSLPFTVLISAFVASGPVHRYLLSGFSPPMMGFLILAAFLASTIATRSNGKSQAWMIAAGVIAGLAGWWRPEGFVIAPLFVALGLLMVPTGFSIRWIRPGFYAALPFLALLAGWILFRVTYFGNLLPTSAVMKGGGFASSNFLLTLQFVTTALLPAIGLIMVIGLMSRRPNWLGAGILLGISLIWINGSIPSFWWDRVGFPMVPGISDFMTSLVLIPLLLAIAIISIRRGSRLWLVPLVLLIISAFWVMFETTLNWWMRMQWPLVPVVGALILTLVLPGSTHVIAATSRVWWQRISFSVLFIIPISLFHLPWGGYSEFPFHAAVSRALELVDTSDLRIASTEAGLVPLAVTGPALDPWGHNNRRIAETRGGALPEELKRFAPTVLVAHGRTSDFLPDSCGMVSEGQGFGPFAADWLVMVETMTDYAEMKGFELIRSTETAPCDAWSIYVDPSVSEEVIEALRSYRIEGKELVIP